MQGRIYAALVSLVWLTGLALLFTVDISHRFEVFGLALLALSFTIVYLKGAPDYEGDKNAEKK